MFAYESAGQGCSGNRWAVGVDNRSAALDLLPSGGVSAFVFIDRAPTTERRFVAVASVQQLRWVLARRYTWLEAAWVRVLLDVFPQPYFPNTWPLPTGAQWLPDPATLSLVQPVITSDTGGFDPSKARQLPSAFIGLIHRQPASTPTSSDREWVTFADGTQERASWVTRKLLTKLLPQESFEGWVYEMRDAPRARRTRAVLRRPISFVALVGEDHEFVRLANRVALLEEIAASLGEEPEAGSL